jgi:hypothetical protein
MECMTDASNQSRSETRLPLATKEETTGARWISLYTSQLILLFISGVFVQLRPRKRFVWIARLLQITAATPQMPCSKKNGPELPEPVSSRRPHMR